MTIGNYQMDKKQKLKDKEEFSLLEDHIKSILIKNLDFSILEGDLLLTKELEKKKDLILK